MIPYIAGMAGCGDAAANFWVLCALSESLSTIAGGMLLMASRGNSAAGLLQPKMRDTVGSLKEGKGSRKQDIMEDFPFHQ